MVKNEARTNRSKWRAVLVGIAGLAVVVLVFVGWLWVLGGGQPNVSVDYVARMNERLGETPEADRAWPVYLEAIAALPTGEDEQALRDLIDGVSPGHERWDGAVRAIETHAAAIETIRRAAGKPVLGYEYTAGVPESYMDAKRRDDREPPPPRNGPPWAIDVMLPHLGEFRHMVRLLRIDALHAAGIGDGARAASAIEAMAGITRHTREHSIVIGQIIAAQIAGFAGTTVREIVALHPGNLDDESLARLDRALERGFTGPSAALVLGNESDSMRDFAQRLYTDDGRGSGRVCAAGISSMLDRGLIMPGYVIALDRVRVGFMSLFSMSRAEFLDELDWMYAQTEAYAATPLWERGANPADPDTRWGWQEPGPMMDLGKFMLQTMMPALGKIPLTIDRGVAEAEAARVVVALERHRLAHGSWPGSLDELTPEFLASIPRDPFDGGSMKYHLRDGRPVVYSVGMNRTDDGGRHVEKGWSWCPPDQVEQRVAGEPETHDGDWVFFPSSRED